MEFKWSIFHILFRKIKINLIIKATVHCFSHKRHVSKQDASRKDSCVGKLWLFWENEIYNSYFVIYLGNYFVENGDFFLERVVKIKQPGDNPRHLPITGSSMENR